MFCYRCTCISLGGYRVCTIHQIMSALCSNCERFVVQKQAWLLGRGNGSWFELIWANYFLSCLHSRERYSGPNPSYWNNKQQQYLWLFGIATHFNLQSDIHTTSQDQIRDWPMQCGTEVWTVLQNHAPFSSLVYTKANLRQLSVLMQCALMCIYSLPESSHSKFVSV